MSDIGNSSDPGTSRTSLLFTIRRALWTQEGAAVVTALATIGLLLSSVFNYLVARSQWSAMQVANGTAESSKRALENEQKAWLAISPLDVKEILIGSGDNEFTFELQNVGNTPALKTNIHKYGFFIRDWTSETALKQKIENRLIADESEPDFQTASFAGALAPTGRFQSTLLSHMDLTQTTLDSMQKGLRVQFYLHVRVEYQDVFLNQRQSEGVYQLVRHGNGWIFITAPYNSQMK